MSDNVIAFGPRVTFNNGARASKTDADAAHKLLIDMYNDKEAFISGSMILRKLHLLLTGQILSIGKPAITAMLDRHGLIKRENPDKPFDYYRVITAADLDLSTVMRNAIVCCLDSRDLFQHPYDAAKPFLPT